MLKDPLCNTNRCGSAVLVAVLLATCLAPGEATAQVPGGGLHPLMPNQELVLQCRLGDGDQAVAAETPLKLKSYSEPAELSQVVELAGLEGVLRVTRFLPKAAIEQQALAESGSQARPLVKLVIKGPTQTFERWLVAGDPEHNRLLSFIGTWRFMQVEPGEPHAKLYDAFARELTRPPMLLVSGPDGEMLERLEARKGARCKVDKLDCTLTVKEFFPHFAFDEKQAKPTNRSDKRLNPAALVEIRRGEQHEERWVFAKFPKFNAGKTSLPVRVQLDCPVVSKRSVPDFAVVAVGRSELEIWTRQEDKCTKQQGALNKPVKVPGSNYEFSLAQYLPAGRLVERYVPAEGRDAVRALELKFEAPDGTSRSVWLAMGRVRKVRLSDQNVLLWFGPRLRQAPGQGPHP